MKKNGFTLVEMMGAVMVLGIVLLISIPVVRSVIKNSKQGLYDTQINNIEEGLKNWAVDNNRLLPTTENEVITLTLGQLKVDGYVETKIINPKSNKCFGNDMLLTITRYQNNYLYEVNKDSGIETENCSDYLGPALILNGEAITYVEVGTSYVDKGAIARSATGSDISSQIVTQISGSGSSINTNKVGNTYTISYSVTSDNETISINRNVVIRDTTPPELVIPGNTAIENNSTSFDVMAGVSATDNSGDTVSISTKSNISFGIPGKYTITYTAKDSSGNVKTKTRIVEIKK